MHLKHSRLVRSILSMKTKKYPSEKPPRGRLLLLPRLDPPICPDGCHMFPVLPADFVPPCLPTFARTPPEGPQWAYEIKHDGFRFMCRHLRSPNLSWPNIVSNRWSSPPNAHHLQTRLTSPMVEVGSRLSIEHGVV